MGLALGIIGIFFFLAGEYQYTCWFWLFAYVFRRE